MLNKQDVVKMVRENILPFWQNMADKLNGGFYGEADFYGNIKKNADKGGVINSRILWTFSAAYDLFKDEAYKNCADRAKDFLQSAFFDNEHALTGWLKTGNPIALYTDKSKLSTLYGNHLSIDSIRSLIDNVNKRFSMVCVKHSLANIFWG